MIPVMRAKLLLRVTKTRGRIEELERRIKADNQELEKYRKHLTKLLAFQKCGS